MFGYIGSGKLWTSAILMSASLALARAADDRQLQSPSVATVAADATQTNATAVGPGRERLAEESPSSGVREILKMLDAGVSTEVVKAYVESAAISSKPTASDMILLKKRGVPDEITVALLKRSAGVSPPVQQGNSQPVPNVVVLPRAPANAAGSAYLDPESYEYFQYYYLYPRTLASAYDRLGLYPWVSPWPYSAGYYPHGPYFPGPGYYGFRQAPVH
jgi:hypothetical protein